MKGNFLRERARRAVHRRRQPLLRGARAGLRHRLQPPARHSSRAEGPAGPRLLLHGADRGSGIFADPAADRLAGLQRLHHGDQADQGIHRRHRPPQDQGQHGHRARHRRAWRWPSISTTWSCSPATATSAGWSRRCSAGACASRSSAPSGPSRRWSPTSCAARPTTSSSCTSWRRCIAREHRAAVAATTTTGRGRRRNAAARRAALRPVRPAGLSRRPIAAGGARARASRAAGATARCCPRLVGFRQANRGDYPDWHNAPVPSFGDRDGTAADRRAGARPARRQPHRPAVHRRLCRRSALLDPAASSASPGAPIAPTRTTACA